MYISGQIGLDTTGQMVSGGVEKEAVQVSRSIIEQGHIHHMRVPI